MTEAGLRVEGREVKIGERPYRGLSYYAERDAAFFFGREEETSIIAANLVASRLTLLYGASGVGKSSLLRAGVTQYLREQTAENLRVSGKPGFVVVVFPSDEEPGEQKPESWRDQPVEALAVGIARAVEKLGLDIEPVNQPLRFAELLEAWNERIDGDLLLVLDQFEEYFLYHNDEAGEGTLYEELPRALNRSALQTNILISIRDDAYSKLDRFKGRIPFLYENYLRVDHLKREAARAAIERPIEQWNRLVAAQSVPVAIEPTLVEAVLDDVQTGNVMLGQTGRGTVEDGEARDARIETPFLQLVLERLWTEDIGAGGQLLRLKTFERLGRAEAIVRTHLDTAMHALADEDKDIAARVFRQLVTPSGTKIAHLPSDLAALEDVPLEPLARVLETLAGARILRPVAPPAGETESRYEIFHDVLAPAVLDWRARYEHARERRRLAEELARQDEERKAAEARAEHERAVATRFRIVAGAAGIFAVAALGLAAWAVASQHEAASAKRKADASSLVAKATAELSNDPAAALDFAIEAARKASTDVATLSILRQAALGSHLAAVLDNGGAPLADVAFAEDGSRLVTIEDDGSGALWDVRTGRRIGELHTNSALKSSVIKTAFSGDGRLLAIEDDYRGVTVWDTKNAGRLLSVYSSGSFALSPDGRFLALTEPSRLVKITDLKSRTRTHLTGAVVPGAYLPAVAAFSPDGARLLLENARHRVMIWDLPARRFVALRPEAKSPGEKPPTTPVLASWSMNSKLVATARSDGFLEVFDAGSGKPLLHARRGGRLSSIAFAPNGMLVLGGLDGEGEIWNPRSGRTIPLRGHTDAITSISFSPDGRSIVTGASDETARIWDTVTGTPKATLLGHTDRVTSVAFSPRGDRIATTGDDGTARLWRPPALGPQVTLPKHLAAVGHATFIRKGQLVLTTSADGSAFVSRAATGRLVHVFGRRRALSRFDREFADEVSGFRPNASLFLFEARAAISEDGTRLAIGDQRRGGATLWNAESGKSLRTVAPESAELVRLDLGPHGRWGAVATRDSSVLLFNSRTGHRQRVLGGGSSWEIGWPAGAASADGTYLATAESFGDHFRLQIRNVITGQAVTAPVKGSSRVRVVAFDRRGRHVTGGTWGGAVWIWNVGDGSVVHSLTNRVPVRALAFSPDGSVLAVAGDGNSVDLRDTRTGKKLATLRGHRAAINSVAYSPNGRLIATASDDGTVRIWGAKDHETWEVLRQGGVGHVLDASFDPTSRRIAVAASDGTSLIYRCRVCRTPQQLLELAEAELPLHSHA